MLIGRIRYNKNADLNGFFIALRIIGFTQILKDFSRERRFSFPADLAD